MPRALSGLKQLDTCPIDSSQFHTPMNAFDISGIRERLCCLICNSKVPRYLRYRATSTATLKYFTPYGVH